MRTIPHGRGSVERRGRNPEGGYALLLVYAMAATVAVMLYMQIPRVAFEAQRDKEQLLIDRGEQYKRAVQLYVRKYNRFPGDMQALENTQNIRFLRRQYVDPLTGKNEWRLIHVGPGGVFLDSAVHKQKADQKAAQTFITELQQIGGGPTGGTADGVNLATRRRPSDGPGGQADPFAPATSSGAASSGNTSAPLDGPVMVLPDGRIVAATSNGVPGQATAAGQGQFIQPGQGQNQFVPGQLPGGVGIQQGTQQAAPPTPAFPPGFQTTPNGAPGPPPQSAANLINQILTTPRPGGLNGEGGFAPGGPQGGFSQGVQGALAPGNFGTPVQSAANAQGQTIGGGIAGVASKLERQGIKIYGERQEYHEWEFVYDLAKDLARAGGRGALGQQQGQQPGQQSGQPRPGQQTATPSPFFPGTGTNPANRR